MLNEGSDTLLEDDRLRLIFTCCHPALNLEAQVALTLRTLGGLSTAEIARAFLVPEPTLAQRLVRAKQKIRARGHPLPVAARPSARRAADGGAGGDLPDLQRRLRRQRGRRSLRRDLCGEAIRLGRLLAALMPQEPEALGLLALMLLHDARRERAAIYDRRCRCCWMRRIARPGIRLRSRRAARWSSARCSCAGPALPGAGGDRRAACPGGDAGADRLATDRGAVQRAGRLQPIAGRRAEPGGRRSYGVWRGVWAGADRSPGFAGALEQYRWLHTTRGELLRRLGRWQEAAAAYPARYSYPTTPPSARSSPAAGCDSGCGW